MKRRRGTIDLGDIGRGARMPFPHSDRPVDVLDPDLAAIRKADVNAIADAFVHDRRNADAPWLGQRLEPRGNVDAVAINIVALDNDIAEIDADTQYYRLTQGFVGWAAVGALN